MELRKIIEDGLRKKGITLTQLAKNLGITSQAIYDMYKANDIKLSRLVELSKVLGVPVSTFFEDIPGVYTQVAQGNGINQLVNS